MSATVLNESAFMSEVLSVTLERTTEGKIKATVTPNGAPSAFFLRVMVKQRNWAGPRFGNCGSIVR